MKDLGTLNLYATQSAQTYRVSISCAYLTHIPLNTKKLLILASFLFGFIQLAAQRIVYERELEYLETNHCESFEYSSTESGRRRGVEGS